MDSKDAGATSGNPSASVNTPPPADQLIAESGTLLQRLAGSVSEILTSPLNLSLLAVTFYLIYKIIQDRRRANAPRPVRPPPLPKLPKKDYTLEELKVFNGLGPEGRILMAVNGKVFDVTRGKSFYGPGGPYGIFAGRDASRGLGTFALDDSAVRDTYDDLSDLTLDQMNTVKDWEQQFQDKYHLVGRLLRPGEEPTDYALEEEEEASQKSAADSLENKTK
ncbi:membrane-associated progesterone receptor component 1-like [Paramacrobiotus metropolitanus]|uniref:membrane-associated progesterone receptor component 1-like n=1 Tax=Paramacrobiotus metropolitanus TaxID=2943436 RepID=UPI002446253F|nr:membrane-associated progesterone receptor component 1-like [Paramacrobiotus metropolitanus]